MKCEICGKLCKNQHGISIHKGHMHQKKLGTTFTNLEQEVQTLKLIVADLTNTIRQLQTNSGNGGSLMTPTLSKVPSGSLPFGMNYGIDHAELMSELKSVLQDRQTSFLF